LADGKEVATATVKADLRREGRVVVTTRSISSGQTIESIDLELVERTLDSGRADWIRRPREVVGMVARTRIPKGRAIRASQIKSPPVVCRRDDVVVEAHVGARLVEGRRRALEEGAVGDTIRVRMEPRNNLVLARVVDSRRVRLASQ